MAAASSLLTAVAPYLRQPTSITTAIGALVFFVILVILFRLLFSSSSSSLSSSWGKNGKKKQPPAIPDTIPCISNTYLYLRDLPRFLRKAAIYLEHNDVVTFRLGHKKVYMVQGPQNIQPMLRVTNEFGSEAFIALILKPLDMSPEDIAKFAGDRTGRLKKRAPWMSEGGGRYWYGLHRVYEDFMTRAHYSARMADRFRDVLAERLTLQPEGQWVEGVGLFGFLKQDMTESALVAMCGPRILELNPGFAELSWEFDEIAFYLLCGPPRWWDARPYQVRDRFNGAIGRYLDEAWEKFDWNGPDAEADWEEHFGSRFSREMVKWFLDSGFTMRSTRGWMSFVIFALISNIVPITTWALYEIVRDPNLFAEVRREVMTAFTVDPATGERVLNTQKLLSLPLLQSILVETLRLHLSLNLVREVNKPEGIFVDGYHVPRGSLVQVVTRRAHHDEATWGSEGHPASEFWAHRHIKNTVRGGNVKEKDEKAETIAPEFLVTGKPGSFIPFGGGAGICPGRFVAKQEVFMTLALLVARFDIEFVEWASFEGKRTEEPPCDDPKYSGAIAMPPDREMKIRWKRLW